MRIYSKPEKRLQLEEIVGNLPTKMVDGPYKRIAQIRARPIFSSTYQKFISDQLNPNKWQHELREDFRKHHWQLLCSDRGHHFGGTSNGVKKAIAVHLLQKWAHEACRSHGKQYRGPRGRPTATHENIATTHFTWPYVPGKGSQT